MGGSASTEKPPPTSTTDPAAPAPADPEAGGDDGGSLAASVALLKELPKTVAAAKDIVALKAFTADEAAHLLETDETKLCTTAVAKQLAEGEEVIASWPTLMCSEYNFQYERTVVLTSAALYRCERVEKKEGAEVTVETAINAKVPLADVARVSRRLLEMGCYEISLGDTIGRGTPEAVDAAVVSVSLPQKLKMATSRPPLGQLPGTKRCGKRWNSRSVSRKTTGSWFASSWFRMKAGFIAISCHRYSFVPSSTLSSPATEGMLLGISMALQQILFRSHEESRRFVLVAYLGEYSETPTNLLSFCLHCELMSVFSLLTSIPRFSIVSNFSSCS